MLPIEVSLLTRFFTDFQVNILKFREGNPFYLIFLFCKLNMFPGLHFCLGNIFKNFLGSQRDITSFYAFRGH